MWGVQTVANTIFPQAFYRPDSEDARERLYRLHARTQRIHSRRRYPENYFNRLVSYPSSTGENVNQLEFIIAERLLTQLNKKGPGGPLSSAYELGLTEPDADLRIHAPGKDRNIMSFPCLSHISLTLGDGRLNLAALYRNQQLVGRAYGNYLGLARLGQFIATEAGVQLGEILCIATHADAEANVYGTTRLDELVTEALGERAEAAA